MEDNKNLEFTVVFANTNVRTHVANAMADAIVEMRGRLQYLSERGDSKATDVGYAIHVMEYMSSCIAELRTLDG